MPLSLLLLLSLAAIGTAALLQRALGLRRVLFQRRVVLIVLSLSVLLSIASALVRSSGASGTGTRTSYGFPKPFYFAWLSWEAPISTAGIDWLYFLGNCIGWFAVVSLVTTLGVGVTRIARASRV